MSAYFGGLWNASFGRCSKSVKQQERLHEDIAELRGELKALATELRQAPRGAKDATATRGASFVSTSVPMGAADLTAAAAAGAPHPFSEGVPGSALAVPANEIVAHVWPQVSHWATEFLLKEVDPALRAALPPHLSAQMDPNRSHLGHEPVQFSSIKIFDRKEWTPDGFCDNIVFRCRMEWHGDPSIFLQMVGTAAGVQGVVLKGHLLVELVHMLPYPPMFKGVRLFFLDPPTLDLTFSGIGSDVLNASAINRRIIDVFQSQLSCRVVAPKFMGFKMVNTDIFAITSPAPEGILRVTVWNAIDLLPMDVSFFGKGTSDPYVKIRCGAHVLKSETCWKTLSPEFNFVASMPISSLHDQNIWIEVYDQDIITRDDFLGKVSLPVDLLATWGRQKKVTVQLRNDAGEKGKNGSVCLSAEWQPMVSSSELHHSGIIDVGVYSAMNVPPLGPYARYWISATCTQLMPCSSSEPQCTEQQYGVKVHDRAEVDDGDMPLLHRLQEKKEMLQKKGFSHREICEVLDLDPAETDLENFEVEKLTGIHVARWRRSVQFLSKKADDAEITLTLMAQGNGQPKATELGSFTRHMAEVVKAKGLFYTETVRLPGTDITLYFKIQLHDLAEVAVAGKPERQKTYRTDALGDTHSVTSL